jgi:oxygen-independent coproporphyrinogen-3 oxidase
MSDLFSHKDNEFVAWYPTALAPEDATTVWKPHRAAYYVHIPFCSAICDYCGFAVERRKGAQVERYLSALHQEIERYASEGRLTNYRFDCGHFGGGTPSAIEATQLLSIKKLIDELFDVTSDAEITVEVNPISFTLDKAQAYYQAGVNRISFGLQSFNEKTLRTIGRPHRSKDVEQTLQVIQQVGWDNYSLDIIYGVPGQTLDDLRDDLLRAAHTGATHISCFRLEIIPFTVLKLREAADLIPPRLDEGLLNAMDDLVTSVLTGQGYREYGAFNFARPGYESVHNAIAFIAPQSEYVGFGNSAFSFINGYVYTNYADLPSYQQAVFEGRHPISLARPVSSLEAMSRYFVLGVKFFRVPRAAFIQLFGQEPEQVFGDVLLRLLTAELLVRDGDDYLLTRKGRKYVNNVCKEFYVGENRGQRQHLQFIPTLTPQQISYYARLRHRSVSAVPSEDELHADHTP